ncbi:MAG: hypothetical protein K0U39_09225 [Alphaproteobacteria bacterium]|nr:hypothetical protein [Alphaproteobacteria bacterium]
MKKILLALMLLLLPSHAVALTYFYVGVGTVSGESGELETTIVENDSNPAFATDDYIVRAGYGLSLGFTFDNVSVESRWLSYGMKDYSTSSKERPSDFIERTTNLIGRIGTDFFGVRLSMGYGEAVIKPVILPEAKFDVLSKGIGVDLNISFIGKTRIFVDYYDNSYQHKKFNNSVYQETIRDHSLIYAGMSFPLRLGSIFNAATP